MMVEQTPRRTSTGPEVHVNPECVESSVTREDTTTEYNYVIVTHFRFKIKYITKFKFLFILNI